MPTHKPNLSFCISSTKTQIDFVELDAPQFILNKGESSNIVTIQGIISMITLHI